MTSLAVKVRGLREAKELSLTQIADCTPMQKSYLSRIEQGEDANLGRKKLQGLAKALDVSIDYLVDDSIDEKRSWEKVATDESLKLFLKKNYISDEEEAGLRRISFRESTPRTLREWEQTWDRINAYFQPKRFGKTSKNKPRSHKKINSDDSLTNLPAADTNFT